MLCELITDARPGHFTVDLAMNGREAVNLALAHPPAVAVLDIEMPLLDGLQAGAAIRAARGGMLLIAMSGNPESLNKASLSGTFDYVLAKPVDFDELVELLDRDPAGQAGRNH